MPHCHNDMRSLLHEHIRDLLRRSKLRDDVARKASRDFLANVSAEDVEAARLLRRRRSLQSEIVSVTDSCKWLAMQIRQNEENPCIEATVKCRSCGAHTPWVGSGPTICICGKVGRCVAGVPFSVPFTDIVEAKLECQACTTNGLWNTAAKVRQERFDDFVQHGDLSCLRDVMLLNSLLLCAALEDNDGAFEKCVAANPECRELLGLQEAPTAALPSTEAPPTTRPAAAAA